MPKGKKFSLENLFSPSVALGVLTVVLVIVLFIQFFLYIYCWNR